MIWFSFLFAYWARKQFLTFSYRMNRQAYTDFQYLVEMSLDFKQWCSKSTLQPKGEQYAYIFFIFMPLISFLFYRHEHVIILIGFVLVYLSIIDYFYYLTDIRYVGLIFILSLFQLLNQESPLLYEYIHCLFISSVFLIFFTYTAQTIFNKEVLGWGDVLLLLALSPLFILEEMLIFILLSCVLGIIFTLCYWIYYRRKLAKLPFIPFISLAFLLIEFLSL